MYEVEIQDDQMGIWDSYEIDGRVKDELTAEAMALDIFELDYPESVNPHVISVNWVDL